MLARVFRPARYKQYRGDSLRLLRWKLLIIASILAAMVGAGTFYAVAYLILDHPPQIEVNVRVPIWLTVATLIVPLAATTYASIFVYRHTARRRTLQAIATALLALLLTFMSLFLDSIFLHRSTPEIIPPAKQPSNLS
jgi:hypothetical protein